MWQTPFSMVMVTEPFDQFYKALLVYKQGRLNWSYGQFIKCLHNFSDCKPNTAFFFFGKNIGVFVIFAIELLTKHRKPC